MEHRSLGRTGIKVSRLCLGTMTFGEQNTADESHALLDRAFEAGIDFIDTAEIYPFPGRAETYGVTETIVGDWMKRRGVRDRIVLATKIAGPGAFPYIRDGKLRFDRRNVERAVDDSLERLQTDRIDLYQLHWPERQALKDDESLTPFAETLTALDAQVRAGKIRAVGLANETPWGTMTSLALAERYGWPRIASVQNRYSLLNREFEPDFAEVARNEDCGLLAYSPLAMGVLSGKYLGGAWPEKARLTLFKDFRRYTEPGRPGAETVAAYVALAKRYGLEPAQMALAFTLGRPFVTSVIIGCTTLQQLEANLGSTAVSLSRDVLEEIDDIHRVRPNPPKT